MRPRLDIPPLGDVLEFMRLVWALDHRLQAASKSMGTRLGVTGPQRLAVRLIGKFPGITAGRLAQLLHLHPSTVTGILDRLDRQRLIRRWSDPRDARRVQAGLTDAGRAIDAMTDGTIEEAVRRALARLSDEQVSTAREVFRALMDELPK